MPSIRKAAFTSVAVFALALVHGACKFDGSYRDVPDPGLVHCSDGEISCNGTVLSRCTNDKHETIDDCGSKGQVCAPAFLKCTPCLPNAASCDGFDVVRCDADGQKSTKVETCDSTKGIACRNGVCTNLCDEAAIQHSNVGCEYWGVDLDNAVTSQGNAAAQQYAIVVSNAEPDLVANVTVEEDVAQIGQPQQLRTIATARVGPHTLEVFKLGPKEVDGSAPGTFDTGTGTALSRGAFRVTTDVPIVAYQFNPLENVNVFSNDASLLFPTASLGGGGGRTYVIAAWPQTIAISDDPATNFGQNLRTFLALVGTKPNTLVHVKTSARIIGGGPIPDGVKAGDSFDVTLQPFEVMNLETGDFNADFTGTLIDASGPIAVFPGSEASDAPFFAALAQRSCCADHLESQATPVRAVGKQYVLGRVPNRTKAVAAAGAVISPFDEAEIYRVVATQPGMTRVSTSLPVPNNVFELDGEGSDRTLIVHQDFQLSASAPVIVADLQVSQEAAGVARGLPGGDPSLTFVTPVEQWRNDYVFLTPDKYAFDFVVIAAPAAASVFLDGLPVDGTVCELAPGDGLDDKTRGGKKPDFLVYRCQLSFPVIDPDKVAPNNVLPGRQNDGVHRVQADYPVGIVVYGFDSFVSYAYAGGTELKDLNPQ